LSGIPFLCNFVDRVDDNPTKNYSTDFREFLAKLNLLPKNHHYSDKCVLILSRTLDLEADRVCIELLRRGLDYLRLNAEDIPYTLSITNNVEQGSDTKCQVKLDSLITNLSDISAVWLRNFDYGLIHSNSNDLNTAFIFQQWSDALEILYSTIEYRWINSLDATHRTSNRIKQLTYAKQAGFNIPSTLITNDPERALSFYRDHNGDIILKVLHHHDIEVNSKVYSIYTHRVTDKDLSMLNDLIYAPSILQERIRNSSELRVTVIKDKVFSVKLGLETLALSCDDMHRVPMSRIPKRPIQLEKELEQRCIKLINSLGLDYGAVDFIIDEDGKLFFLEVNPTGDWLWIEHDTKLPITRAVVDLLEHVVKSSV
jgi:glutathione synthase/RimK-type ligase-like ATP-grasp enzyme